MVILQRFSHGYDALRLDDPDNFKPDGKAQITGIYDNDWNLVGIDSFTICYQNAELHRDETDERIKELAYSCMEGMNIGEPKRFLINPTGRFEIGGFIGDAGLTGRKIVVDSYHGFAPVGGGAFSGKDPTKVDRSGAYKAREIAKDYLSKLGLRWCKVQLSYSIGIAKPMAIYITSNIGDIDAPEDLYEECTLANIIKDLHLLEQKYEPLAAFGHFK
jgi:S-adenosylmethionine synthetase